MALKVCFYSSYIFSRNGIAEESSLSGSRTLFAQLKRPPRSISSPRDDNQPFPKSGIALLQNIIDFTPDPLLDKGMTNRINPEKGGEKVKILDHKTKFRKIAA